MKLVILDGYTENPGDLSWDAMARLGELTVYDYTAPADAARRMADAEAVITNKTVLTRELIEGAKKLRYIGILATGYNGVPSGLRHCEETGCLREQLGVPSGQRHEICRGLHAEQNVIIQAAVHGISLAGAEVYCTHQPCLICSKMLINCGITKIWYASGYPDELAMQMLNEAGITLELLPLRPTPDGCGHTGPSGEGA